VSEHERLLQEIILKNRDSIRKAQLRIAEAGKSLQVTRQLILSSRRLIDQERVHRARKARPV
jgi:hypothetical protein